MLAPTETVAVVEIGESLPTESASPMFVTAPVFYVQARCGVRGVRTHHGVRVNSDHNDSGVHSLPNCNTTAPIPF